MQLRIRLIALLAGGLFAGCGEVDAAIDCHQICSRYSECYDTQYDVAACDTRCRSHSADDTEYRHAANECDACIYDRACTSATFN